VRVPKPDTSIREIPTRVIRAWLVTCTCGYRSRPLKTATAAKTVRDRHISRANHDRETAA
jgi:hypothetical protein